MAKILMGAIVTDIRGRLNGHAFRKSASGLVIQKSALPRSQTFYAKNPQLQNLKQGAINWNSLDLAARNAYRAFSLANPIKNTFGNPITLSGRAMAQKLIINSLFVNNTVPDTKTLSNCLENVDLAYKAGDQFTLVFQSEGGASRLLVRATAGAGCNPYNSFAHLPRIAVAQVASSSGSVNLATLLPSQMIDTANVGFLHVQLSEVNAWGWEGMRQNFTFHQGDPYIE